MRAGTSTTAMRSSGNRSLLRIVSERLAVDTLPPKNDAHASSNAPVRVTSASRAALIPSLNNSRYSKYTHSGLSLLRTTAFANIEQLHIAHQAGISHRFENLQRAPRS